MRPLLVLGSRSTHPHSRSCCPGEVGASRSLTKFSAARDVVSLGAAHPLGSPQVLGCGLGACGLKASWWTGGQTRAWDHCWLPRHCLAVLAERPTFRACPPRPALPRSHCLLKPEAPLGPGHRQLPEPGEQLAEDERCFCLTASCRCVPSSDASRPVAGAGSARLGENGDV